MLEFVDVWLLLFFCGGVGSYFWCNLDVFVVRVYVWLCLNDVLVK